MQKILHQFASIVENPYVHLAEWKKKTGKKVVGCTPMYVPEEIIDAAGMLPVVLLGGNEDILQADKHNHPYFCHSTRSNFDMGLQGRFDFMDLLVFSDCCYTWDAVSDSWSLNEPSGSHHHFLVPTNMDGVNARKYLSHGFDRLKSALERLAGRDIDDESLQKSISLYNIHRKLLHRLYELRKTKPQHLRAWDVATIVAAGMLMPKEEHCRLLSQFIDRLEAIPSSPNDKSRLIMSGYFCDIPEKDLLDLLEDAGAEVIDDDLYVGKRYFSTPVDESLSPMNALVERYLTDIPCPTKYSAKNNWAMYVSTLAETANAEGVIIVAMKWCHHQNMMLPDLTCLLSEKGIAHLVIETDYTGITGQVRTRIEAFLEMLRG